MMWRAALLLMAGACAFAQSFTLSVVNSAGTTVSAGQVYGFGQIAPGNTQSAHFRITNNSSTALTITNIGLTAPSSSSAPQGFSLVGAPTLPYALAAAATVDFNVAFSNSTPGNYSSTLTINTNTVILLATSVGTAVVSVTAPCTLAGSAITFTSSTCSVTMTNPTTQAFPVSPVTLTGAGFSGLPSSWANGVTIAADSTQNVVLTYSGTSAGTGTLVVGLNTYTLAAGAASTTAPVTLSSVATDGSGTLTAVGSTFDFGQVAVGDTKTIQFRAVNNGSSPVTIATLCVEPTGSSCPVTMSSYFSVVNSSTTPFVIAQGSSATISVRFSGPAANSYTATLLVNSQQVNLTATAVPAPTLSVASPCSGPDSNNYINFGRVQQNGKVNCAFTLKNTNSQDLTMSSSLAAGAFSGLLSNTITVPANQSISIILTFTAPTTSVLCGLNQQYNACAVLIVGPRTYTLAGVSYTAPIPQPTLTFDTKTFNSGEQHTLTISLPFASTVSTTGTLTLAFKPQPTSITDDSAITFLSSTGATASRVVNYTVTAGSVAVTLNGQSNVTFATGTTAGTITFSMTAGIYGFAGDPTTTITLAQMPVAISAASLSTNTGELIVSVTAFDNTYTMGPMTFAFFDTTGLPIGQPISADFTNKQTCPQCTTATTFASFYQGDTQGSAFNMGVYFPVTGDATKVGYVDVSLKNSVGTTTASKVIYNQ